MSGQLVHAQTKVYQYDGKLPFVQMMLNMMTAMGILDRLPDGLANGSNRQFGYPSSAWSRNNYLDSPWGNPSWGVLPSESYSRNNYSPYGSRWSTNDLDGWVNESWENSQWNPNAERQYPPDSSPQAKAPIIQNFNYGVTKPSDNSVAQNSNQAPLEKYSGSGQQSKEVPEQYKRQPAVSKNSLKQQPCVTEYCGLKKPNLNGLWVASNGEMLGVKNNRYLWSDSKSRYLTGQIKMQHKHLLANIDGYEQLMRFKYKLDGNNLITMQPNGEVREFVRVSANQYNNLYRGYEQSNGRYY